jgi:hypothetical protein
MFAYGFLQIPGHPGHPCFRLKDSDHYGSFRTWRTLSPHLLDLLHARHTKYFATLWLKTIHSPLPIHPILPLTFSPSPLLPIFLYESEGKPKMVRTDPASAGDLDLRQSKNEEKNQKKKAVLRIIWKQPHKSFIQKKC